MLLIFGSWALWALRDRPIQEYLAIFFMAALLTSAGEEMMLRVFHLYEWRMRLLPDPKRDTLLASLVVGWLDPLLGVLYARYCNRVPVRRALLGAAALGCLEVVLVKSGYMIYRHWSALFTIGAFFVYFLVVRQINRAVTQIPLWLHVYGATLWSRGLTDILLQGIFRLWHFNIVFLGDRVGDDRLISALLHFLLIVPLVVWVSLRPVRSQPIWVLGGTAGLLLMEGAARVAGVLVYDHWSTVWSAVKYILIFGAMAVYAQWLRMRQSTLLHGQ